MTIKTFLELLLLYAVEISASAFFIILLANYA